MKPPHATSAVASYATPPKVGEIFECTASDGRVIKARIGEFNPATGRYRLDPISIEQVEPGWVPAFIVEPKDKSKGDFWLAWSQQEVKQLRKLLTKRPPDPVLVNENHGQPLLKFPDGRTLSLGDLGSDRVGVMLDAPTRK